MAPSSSFLAWNFTWIPDICSDLDVGLASRYQVGHQASHYVFFSLDLLMTAKRTGNRSTGSEGEAHTGSGTAPRVDVRPWPCLDKAAGAEQGTHLVLATAEATSWLCGGHCDGDDCPPSTSAPIPCSPASSSSQGFICFLLPSLRIGSFQNKCVRWAFWKLLGPPTLIGGVF